MKPGKGKAWQLDLELFKQIVSESYSYTEICTKIGIAKSGNSYKTVINRILYENIDISHFQDRLKYRPVKFKAKSFTIKDCLKYAPDCTTTTVRSKVKEYKLIEYKCSECSIIDKWNNKEIVLHLDHINGDRKDNRIENLRWLCPNCHSQTETYCTRKNKIHTCQFCTKIIPTNKLRCKDCKHILTDKQKIEYKKKDRMPKDITLEVLQKEIEELGYSAVGRKYHVSDNSIRNWLKRLSK